MKLAACLLGVVTLTACGSQQFIIAGTVVDTELLCLSQMRHMQHMRQTRLCNDTLVSASKLGIKGVNRQGLTFTSLSCPCLNVEWRITLCGL